MPCPRCNRSTGTPLIFDISSIAGDADLESDKQALVASTSPATPNLKYQRQLHDFTVVFMTPKNTAQRRRVKVFQSATRAEFRVLSDQIQRLNVVLLTIHGEIPHIALA
jgi:hypothetical protein